MGYGVFDRVEKTTMIGGYAKTLFLFELTQRYSIEQDAIACLQDCAAGSMVLVVSDTKGNYAIDSGHIKNAREKLKNESASWK